MPPRSAGGRADPLAAWLGVGFARPGTQERSFYPELREFLSELLGYPRDRVGTEHAIGGGSADFVFLDFARRPWVVGDFKLDDGWLTDPRRAEALWQDKRKYVTGGVRWVVLLTPHYLQVRRADGGVYVDLLDLRRETSESLRVKLAPLAFSASNHAERWGEFVKGELPHGYIPLQGDGVDRFKADLRESFEDLLFQTRRAFERLKGEYRVYLERREELKAKASTGVDASAWRALNRLEGDFPSRVRTLFESALLRFASAYGRAHGLEEDGKRVEEAFLIDTAISLVARVLFIRFLEDLGLAPRRITNGGLKDWSRFVKHLTGKATALVKFISMDLQEVYREPFSDELFSWILDTNGALDEALQRLILRVNAYDFSGLSEEVIGDVYQDFLPPKRRKLLGEFYTPREIVDYILDQTVGAYPGPGLPRVLDPACGSGSFLVRHLHREAEARRGANPQHLAEALAGSIWGFDLNPFAAFFTSFQLLWGLVRLHREFRGQVHVYALNSLLREAEVLEALGAEYLSEGEKARDTERWDVVVGNPPYVRAERLKEGPYMRELWGEVWGANADTGAVFLYRTLTEWLKDGGRMGMVVSGGYAGSEAFSPVWKLFWPGGEARLRKVVWLEFVERSWDAARVPMILIAERGTPKPEDEVELWVPRAWPSTPQPGEVQRIPLKEFFHHAVNPVVGEGSWGGFILPLLTGEDVFLLRKLYPYSTNLMPLKERILPVRQSRPTRNPPRWTQGITLSGASLKEEPYGNAPRQVLDAKRMALGWQGTPAGWVDMDAVRSRALWQKGDPQRYLAVREVALTPMAVLVRDGRLGALSTFVVGEPMGDEEEAEALAAYLNSALVRWYWAVRFRSGVVEQYWAHVYPRHLDELPWPRKPDGRLIRRLAGLYRELEGLGAESAQSPEAFLEEALRGAEASGEVFGLSLAKGLDWSGWSGTVPLETLRVEGTVLVGDGLLTSLDLRDGDLAEMVFILLRRAGKSPVDGKTLRNLLVPKKYRAILRAYREKLERYARAREAFLDLQDRIDETVFDLFGLAPGERDHVRGRLGTYPLNLFRPRFPWEVEEGRGPVTYQKDRYAI